MNLRTIALAVLSLLCLTINAQKIDFKQGPEYNPSTGKSGNLLANSSVLLNTSDGLYQINSFGSEMIGYTSYRNAAQVSIKKFDINTNKQISEDKIEKTGKTGKALKEPGFGKIGNNVICYGLDNPDKKTVLYVQSCDVANNLKVNQEISFEVLEWSMKAAMQDELHSRFVISPDGNYGAVIYSLHYKLPVVGVKFEDHVFGVVFDKNLNEVSKFTTLIDTDSKKCKLNDACIDNNGNLIALISTSTLSASVIKVDKAATTAVIKELPINGKEIDYISLQSTTGGKYNILGFAKNKGGKEGSTNTVFVFQTDDKLTITKTEENGDNLLKLINIYSNKKNEITGPSPLSNELKSDLQFKTSKGLTLPDGSNIFIFNKYYKTTPANGSTQTHSLDIYVVKIDKEGKITWSIRVPRYIFYSNTIPISYNQDNDELNILFNTHFEDIASDINAPTPNRYINNPDAPLLMGMQIDNTKGEATFLKIESGMLINAPEDAFMDINSPYYEKAGVITIPVKSGNKYSLTTFTFE